MSSIYHVMCSCTNCRKEITSQGLKLHSSKCAATPKYTCLQCGSATNNHKFCSRSCRAVYVNPRRPSRAKPKNHRSDYNTRQNTRYEQGQINSRVTLRKHLARTVGYQCNVCGIHDWNNEKLVLIVDHKDGNAGNNLPSNLQLICPNCNSQSATFSGRNKGNGRKSRGLPTR